MVITAGASPTPPEGVTSAVRGRTSVSAPVVELIVKPPPRGLLRIQTQLGVALAALHVARSGKKETQDDCRENEP